MMCDDVYKYNYISTYIQHRENATLKLQVWGSLTLAHARQTRQPLVMQCYNLRVTMDSANMLCMPLYSPVQGSYRFSSPPPSNTAPQMAARISAAKLGSVILERGSRRSQVGKFANLLSIQPRSTLLHCLQFQGVS